MKQLFWSVALLGVTLLGGIACADDNVDVGAVEDRRGTVTSSPTSSSAPSSLYSSSSGSQAASSNDDARVEELEERVEQLERCVDWLFEAVGKLQEGPPDAYNPFGAGNPPFGCN